MSTGPCGENRELKTWKEVAQYLRISVRTAQNWERELGLPVHRIGTAEKPPVRAWTHELDKWANRSSEAKTASAEQHDRPGPDLFLGHLAICCLTYCALFLLDLFLEIAYQFDLRYGSALIASPLISIWIASTSALGLRVGWRMASSGRHGAFAAMFAIFAASGLAVFGALSSFGVLPSTPVTKLVFPSQTAQAAFLKNVVLYFLPLVTLTWLIPFHYVARLHRHYNGHGPAKTLEMLDKQKTDRLSGLHISVRALVIGMLMYGLLSIILTQDLLRHLVPDRYSNLFMMLAISKSSLYWGHGMLCISWYARAIEAVQVACRAPEDSPEPELEFGAH
jgi:hypothetical protein